MVFALPPTTISKLPPAVPGMSAAVSASYNALVDSAARYASEGKLCLTRAFVGGRHVIQISKSNRGISDYMDADVDSLLATYEFDATGHLVDSAVWSRSGASLSPGEKGRIAKMLNYAFKQEETFPWLKSNVQISVQQVASKYAIYVEPMDGIKAKKGML